VATQAGRVLSSLTVRGRAVVAAAAALLLVGALLGERPLVQLAVFALALPLLSALAVARQRFRISARRTVSPPRVPRGDTAEVTLEIANADTRTGGLWVLTEQLPGDLGASPRFVVERLAPGARSQLHYRVHAQRRGRHVLGPVRLRLVDPFGLVERSAVGAESAPLLVIPRVQPLGDGGPAGGQGGGGEGSRRTIAVHGEDDVSTREYRHGDDLRKVHWRSTARVGKLMVRREERPWQSRATLLLDTRASAHRGDGPGSSFEWAVSAVASIGVHAARRGFSVRLITDAGTTAGGGDIAAEGVLLDHLAEVSASHNPGLEAATSPLRGAEGLGTLIAVLGLLDAEQAALLASTRSPTDVSVGVLVDASGWVGLSPRAQAEAEAAYDAAAEILTRAGWRVLRARHGDTLPRLWPSAGQRPAGGLVGPPAAVGGAP
jgi:uncharacterized protein (DUF58 family)